MVITHFTAPVGDTDLEKRMFQEHSFRSEFERSHFLLNSLFFDGPKKGKMNLIIWNRGHLGEFVYGKLYRETNPEEWVMNLEEEFDYNDSENVYLLLLTADPEFLSQNDDGLSFSSTVDSKKKEIENFKNAFHLSQIGKKLIIDVTTLRTDTKLETFEDEGVKVYKTVTETSTVYKPQENILQEVLEFLNS